MCGDGFYDFSIVPIWQVLLGHVLVGQWRMDMNLVWMLG